LSNLISHKQINIGKGIRGGSTEESNLPRTT
jgi:hypothetical protein